MPFLATDSSSISRPIIGFNVISHLISNSRKEVALSKLTSAFKNDNEDTVNETCKLLACEEVFGVVKSGKHDVYIPAKGTKLVKGIDHSDAILEPYSAVYEPKECNDEGSGLIF